MPKVVRKGDKNSAGGRTLSGLNDFIVDGKPVCPIGTPVSPHKPKKGKHKASKTAQGNTTFIIQNKSITMVGNNDTCGHPRIEGSSTFIVGK